jgi:hypothetical protein
MAQNILDGPAALFRRRHFRAVSEELVFDGINRERSAAECLAVWKLFYVRGACLR